ncbi:MAG TPA: GlsB/YeaQ/YmgE family stress response membrane protein [bacterium]
MTYAAIVVAGFLIGFLAAFIMRQNRAGMIGFVVVALAGAFVGGYFFAHRITVTEILFVNALIPSAIGAVIFILGIGIFKNTETRSQTA